MALTMATTTAPATPDRTAEGVSTLVSGLGEGDAQEPVTERQMHPSLFANDAISSCSGLM